MIMGHPVALHFNTKSVKYKKNPLQSLNKDWKIKEITNFIFSSY